MRKKSNVLATASATVIITYLVFNEPSEINAHLAHIEQHEFMNHVKGLLFGHYFENVFPELIESLKRFGQRNHIPVVTCDDFGHGMNHGILPIGTFAKWN